MNATNHEFLQGCLKYLGFGENGPLNQDLADQMTKEVAEFQLYTEAFYNDGRSKLEAKLYFTKSAISDYYFFNKYDALLRDAIYPEKERAQTIYIDSAKGFTFKETFNLLEGRAVYKELFNSSKKRYLAWHQLDFTERDSHGNYKVRHYGKGYGYDLEAAVKAYPIVELQNEELREALMKSLQKGNLHQVTFVYNNKRRKYYIEASPKSRVLVIHPQAMSAASQNSSVEDDFLLEPSVLPDSDPSADSSSEDDKEPTPGELEIIGVPAEIAFPPDGASLADGRVPADERPEVRVPAVERPEPVTATRSTRKRILK